MTIHDWADHEADALLDIIARSGFTRGSVQRSVAKRLREIADQRVANHAAGVDRAFDRVFGPGEVADQ